MARTDPQNPDTDGDGILDGTEYARGDDPTLFDALPPQITVRVAKFDDPDVTDFPSGETKYYLVYSVEDASGIARSSVLKDGEEQKRFEYASSPVTVYQPVEFKTGLTGSVMDTMAGTTVEITATDAHGNENLVVGLQRSNMVGHLAGVLADSTLDNLSPAWSFRLALFSGIMTNLGDTFRNIEELWELLKAPDTLKRLVEGLYDTWAVLSDTELWPQLLDAMIQQYHDRMALNNPFEAGETRYDRYAAGWYSGYALGFVGKMVLGGAVLKAAKGATLGQKIVVGLEKTPGLKQLLVAKRAADRLQARAIAGMVQGSARVGVPVLKGAKSVGSAIETRYLVREADVDAVDLSDAGQERLGVFVRRSGDDGARLIDELDAEQVQRTFGGSDVCGALHFGASSTASGFCLSDVEMQRWGGVIRRSELDVEERRRHVDAMNALDDQQAALRLFEATGDDGIRAVSRLVEADNVDADAVIRRLDEFDGETKRGVTEALSDGVDAERVSKSLERYEGVDNQEQFEELLSHNDPEVRNSWLRTSGDDQIPSDSISDALRWADELEADHRLTRFRKASDVNNEMIVDSYTPGTITLEFKTRSGLDLDRAFEVNDPDDPNPGGSFFAPDGSIPKSADPHQIKEIYALDYVPDARADATIPRGKEMRVGKVNENYGEDGGGLQYQYLKSRHDGEYLDVDEVFSNEYFFDDSDATIILAPVGAL